MKNFFSKLQQIFRSSSATENAKSDINDQQSEKTEMSSKQYPETVRLSAQTNGVYAQKIKPEAIVMHDTMGNYAGSIDWTNRIMNPQTNKRLYASYHCIIARDGRRTITNHDDNRAYHAGTSSFKGRHNLNRWSIGVAFERNSHTEPLQPAAIESALQYIIPRMKKWGITPDWVTDHRTVSPDRKQDLKKQEFEKFHAALVKNFKN
jgi:N-acetyl-anhydromuramyl-L-alanine amidase AmpD